MAQSSCGFSVFVEYSQLCWCNRWKARRRAGKHKNFRVDSVPILHMQSACEAQCRPTRQAGVWRRWSTLAPSGDSATGKATLGKTQAQSEARLGHDVKYNKFQSYFYYIFQAFAHGGSRYYNYKGSHSLILMAVSDAKYRFLMVDFGSSGRRGDANVMHHCPMGKKLEKDNLHIPNSGPAPGVAGK